eukprot:3942390-Pyramimonas_sp.AAC.1
MTLPSTKHTDPPPPAVLISSRRRPRVRDVQVLFSQYQGGYYYRYHLRAVGLLLASRALMRHARRVDCHRLTKQFDKAVQTRFPAGVDFLRESRAVGKWSKTSRGNRLRCYS